MVLFDEDPKHLLKETTAQFKIAPDRDSLSRISLSLYSLSNARQSRLGRHQNHLKTLSRKLNSLEEGRRWEEDRHDVGGHAERMLRMDTEKFRVAKGASDVGIEVERLEGELGRLRGVLEGLEQEGVEGGGRGGGTDGEDEVVLKLHIYRSLGILASQDPTTGEFNRAVIRRRKISDCADGTGGSEKADVSVVNVDSKLDQGFYTGMFWDAL